MREIIKGHVVALQGYLGASRADCTPGFTVTRLDGTPMAPRTTEGIRNLGRGRFEVDWQAPPLESPETDLVYTFDDGLEPPAQRQAWDGIALTVPGISAPIERVEFAYSSKVMDSDGDYVLVTMRPYDRFDRPVMLSLAYGAYVRLANQVGPGVWILDPLKVSSNKDGEMVTVLRPPSGDFGLDVDQTVQIELIVPGMATPFLSEALRYAPVPTPTNPDLDVYADLMESDPEPGSFKFRKTELHVQFTLQTFDTQHRPLPGAFVEWFVDNPKWPVPQASRYSDERGQLVVTFPIPSNRSAARITAKSGSTTLTWHVSQSK